MNLPISSPPRNNMNQDNELLPLNLGFLESPSQNHRRSISYSFDISQTMSNASLPSVLRSLEDSPPLTYNRNNNQSEILILPQKPRSRSQSITGPIRHEKKSEKQSPYPKLNSEQMRNLIKQQSKEHLTDPFELKDNVYIDVETIPRRNSLNSPDIMKTPILQSFSPKKSNQLFLSPSQRLNESVHSHKKTIVRDRSRSLDYISLSKKSKPESSFTIPSPPIFMIHATYLDHQYHFLFQGNNLPELCQELRSVISHLPSFKMLFEHPRQANQYLPLNSIDQLYDHVHIIIQPI
ncbi:hypothetical protein WA158_007991 [Blastocystis sp. Blastoise]